MKLEHLKYEDCPHCKARVISESQRSQHTNGEWFETQEYKCGGAMEYVPNFSREQVKRPCPLGDEAKRQERKRRQALLKLDEFINGLDVDESFRESILGSVA